MVDLDATTVVTLATALGVGGILKAVADKLLSRKKNEVDLTSVAIDITATVMREMRSELDDTRKQLFDTRTDLARAQVELTQAHKEIAELRTALTNALAELANYQKTTTTTTSITAPAVSPVIGIPPIGKAQ